MPRLFIPGGSGLAVDVRDPDSPEEVALIAAARRELNLEGATLCCVPVPEERNPRRSFRGNPERSARGGREEECRRARVDAVPARGMAERSGGATLRANVALLEENARVAAAIALALARG